MDRRFIYNGTKRSNVEDKQKRTMDRTFRNTIQKLKITEDRESLIVTQKEREVS
jgi:hypothetical protein